MVVSEFIHRRLKIPYTLYVRENRRGKKSRLTILFLHGIGDTGKIWQPIIEQLPEEYRVVTIDLLGFGHSPQPTWGELNVGTQARSVATTILKLRNIGPVLVVGHSMGGLIAVEIARRHPRIVKGLILCSPPLYKPPGGKLHLLSRDEQLRRMYRRVKKHPEQFLKLVTLAIKYHLINANHEITPENIDSYISALESSIISQSSLDDAQQLKQPVRVLHGVFDPVVVRANLRAIARNNPKIAMKHIFASHEIKGSYVQAVVTAVSEMVAEATKQKS